MQHDPSLTIKKRACLAFSLHWHSISLYHAMYSSLFAANHLSTAEQWLQQSNFLWQTSLPPLQHSPFIQVLQERKYADLHI